MYGRYYEDGRPEPFSSNPLISRAHNSGAGSTKALTYLLLVGDPGLGEHNARTGFTRSASTRESEIKGLGHNCAVVRISDLMDFRDALLSSEEINGGIEYYGHGSSRDLYVGETDDDYTNINSSNINEIGQVPLLNNIILQLYSCSSGLDGDKSIAQMLANHLKVDVIGSVRDLGFTGERGVYLHGTTARPPESGPLYMTPPRQSDWVRFSPK
ncbi:MAG: hypothetical protein H7X93_11050 [Sphingomonadaceae bacterium]|nr:hypothetical protein [Sphingomonadaceae bacterium]